MQPLSLEHLSLELASSIAEHLPPSQAHSLRSLSRAFALRWRFTDLAWFARRNLARQPPPLQACFDPFHLPPAYLAVKLPAWARQRRRAAWKRGGASGAEKVAEALEMVLERVEGAFRDRVGRVQRRQDHLGDEPPQAFRALTPKRPEELSFLEGATAGAAGDAGSPSASSRIDADREAWEDLVVCIPIAVDVGACALLSRMLETAIRILPGPSAPTGERGGWFEDPRKNLEVLVWKGVAMAVEVANLDAMKVLLHHLPPLLVPPPVAGLTPVSAMSSRTPSIHVLSSLFNAAVKGRIDILDHFMGLWSTPNPSTAEQNPLAESSSTIPTGQEDPMPPSLPEPLVSLDGAVLDNHKYLILLRALQCRQTATAHHLLDRFPPNTVDMVLAKAALEGFQEHRGTVFPAPGPLPPPQLSPVRADDDRKRKRPAEDEATHDDEDEESEAQRLVARLLEHERFTDHEMEDATAAAAANGQQEPMAFPSGFRLHLTALKAGWDRLSQWLAEHPRTRLWEPVGSTSPVEAGSGPGSPQFRVRGEIGTVTLVLEEACRVGAVGYLSLLLRSCKVLPIQIYHAAIEAIEMGRLEALNILLSRGPMLPSPFADRLVDQTLRTANMPALRVMLGHPRLAMQRQRIGFFRSLDDLSDVDLFETIFEDPVLATRFLRKPRIEDVVLPRRGPQRPRTPFETLGIHGESVIPDHRQWMVPPAPAPADGGAQSEDETLAGVATPPSPGPVLPPVVSLPPLPSVPFESAAYTRWFVDEFRALGALMLRPGDNVALFGWPSAAATTSAHLPLTQAAEAGRADGLVLALAAKQPDPCLLDMVRVVLVVAKRACFGEEEDGDRRVRAESLTTFTALWHLLLGEMITDDANRLGMLWCLVLALLASGCVEAVKDLVEHPTHRHLGLLRVAGAVDKGKGHAPADDGRAGRLPPLEGLRTLTPKELDSLMILALPYPAAVRYLLELAGADMSIGLGPRPLARACLTAEIPVETVRLLLPRTPAGDSAEDGPSLHHLLLEALAVQEVASEDEARWREVANLLAREVAWS
ncbi:hypothetical protein HDU96_010773 [Phlyctochytrium bullatum]|nr:hypothetical protein HDU96_010773 [Phlyctochytrium bullatum]